MSLSSPGQKKTTKQNNKTRSKQKPHKKCFHIPLSVIKFEILEVQLKVQPEKNPEVHNTSYFLFHHLPHPVPPVDVRIHLVQIR